MSEIDRVVFGDLNMGNEDDDDDDCEIKRIIVKVCCDCSGESLTRLID